MSEESKSHSLQAQTQAFLREFFTKGEELVRDLIEENERLQAAARTGEPLADSESEGLVHRLMRQLEHLENEAAEIKKLAGHVQRETGYRSRLDTLEQEHYHLAAMYVAANQLHCATTVDEVLRTVTEILLNFVGVGQFTVFGVDEERQMLFPLLREGAEVRRKEELSLDEGGPIAALRDSRGPWRASRPPIKGPNSILWLPLCSGTRLVGAIRIEDFLPQKNAFQDNDLGLLELISEHSGIGIETAWIRAHANERPLARRILEEMVP